ncbi:MAG: UDP-N-acetylmuramate dehydrogenase [Candidatus Omnitrophica bacterium]|nr:UDP-N-acetylmuramate dehydrogenase [Candidatus Omnitrophota bacterium]
MLTTSLHQELKQITQGRVKFDEPMRLHTSFRIGGPAEVWLEPQDLEELKNAVAAARAANVPVTLIGGGANLLVRDAGIPGLVIHLNAPAFRTWQVEGSQVLAGAGLGLDRVVALSRDAALGGCEFLSGVPGRVGGAVRMNAGTREGDRWRAMSDIVQEIRVLKRDGAVVNLSASEIGFGYRQSRISDGIVLDARLQLAPAAPEEIGRKITDLMAYKRVTQDLSAPSAGCIFKNPGPDRQPASRLIDRAGLKGMRVGDACVSTRHANFIINQGSAKAADVLALISAVQYKVLQEHGLFLELEVQVLPA